MHKLKLSIIAKDKTAYEGQADAVLVPTTTGIIEVLPGHMMLVSALAKGDIIVKANGKDTKIPISGGVLEVRANSNVIILID